MKTNKKSTFRRVGGLCLVAFGMMLVSCQQEPVQPKISTSPEVVSPADVKEKLVRVNGDDEDQPPKDVGNGGNGGKK